MEKSYKLLNHAKPMPVEEIEKMYNGYWVYVVCAKFSESRELISGIPVILGTRSYDGGADGIYEKYRKKEYEERVGLPLFQNDGFIASLHIIGGHSGQ